MKLDNMNMTTVQLKEIKDAPQLSQIWHDSRRLRISGSRMSVLINFGKKYIDKHSSFSKHDGVEILSSFDDTNVFYRNQAKCHVKINFNLVGSHAVSNEALKENKLLLDKFLENILFDYVRRNDLGDGGLGDGLIQNKTPILMKKQFENNEMRKGKDAEPLLKANPYIWDKICEVLCEQYDVAREDMSVNINPGK
jgi:hypothetical protein